MKTYLKSIIHKSINKSPVLFDIYYRYFKDIQQGSLKRKYDLNNHKKTINNGKNCLIFMNRYWLIHSALEVAFAKEKERNGWNVIAVLCDKAIQICDNDFYKIGNAKPLTHQCKYCSYLLIKLCKRLMIKYVSINDYIKKYNINIGSRRSNYDQFIYSSWIRLIRKLNPDEECEFLLKQKLLESAIVIDSFFNDYFEKNKVDEVIMLNGKFFAESLLIDHCKKRNIKYITYERGAIKETVMFSECSPAIPGSMQKLWNSLKNIELNNIELDELYKYLKNRKYLGNGELVPFYKEINEDLTKICNNYKININKKIIALFTNTIWDSSVVGEDTIFKNMFDWLSTCIDFYSNKPDIQLIIRVHPVEVKVSKSQHTREKVEDYIKKKYGTCASNIIIIPPEEEVSPYVIMDIAELGLVYTSTAGIEMVLTGKPVIVASNAHYANTEFVYTPDSVESFLKLINSNLKMLPEQIKNAEKYSYIYYFKHMIYYGDWIRQIGADYKFIKPINSINILKRAGIEK